MHKLFQGFNVLRQLLRAIAPAVPGAIVVLGVRLAAPGDRTLPRSLAELALYSAITVACTLLLERRLVSELVSYLAPRRSRLSVRPEVASAGAPRAH
jgi:hypothetical protein